VIFIKQVTKLHEKLRFPKCGNKMARGKRRKRPKKEKIKAKKD
jgi:hypothetical protein